MLWLRSESRNDLLVSGECLIVLSLGEQFIMVLYFLIGCLYTFQECGFSAATVPLLCSYMEFFIECSFSSDHLEPWVLHCPLRRVGHIVFGGVIWAFLQGICLFNLVYIYWYLIYLCFCLSKQLISFSFRNLFCFVSTVLEILFTVADSSAGFVTLFQFILVCWFNLLMWILIIVLV